MQTTFSGQNNGGMRVKPFNPGGILWDKEICADTGQISQNVATE